MNKKDLHKFRDFEGIFHFIDNFNTINCNCKLHLHKNFCFRRKTLLIKVLTFSFQGLLGGRKNFKQGFLIHFPLKKQKLSYLKKEIMHFVRTQNFLKN